MTLDDGAAPDPAGRALWYLIPLGVVLVLFVGGALTVSALNGSTEASDDASTTKTADADLADYWTVERGQTYSQIAERTGLTVARLEALNPKTDPSTLAPGQRLKLRSDITKPRKKLGPKFRTIRKGESFGSIAADIGKSIGALRRLNPKLKPATLQPGNRIRLRR